MTFNAIIYMVQNKCQYLIFSTKKSRKNKMDEI